MNTREGSKGKKGLQGFFRIFAVPDARLQISDWVTVQMFCEFIECGKKVLIPRSSFQKSTKYVMHRGVQGGLISTNV